VASSKRERVFEALADPTRRGILELLRREETLAAGEIASRFGGISRPAVSRHLRVLRDAGLLTADERGREWHYRLNVEPLLAMQEEWLAPFVALGETALRRLKRRVESPSHERRDGRREARRAPPGARKLPVQ
jgi:DNA-binding transcriptional ArsR family regulator